MAINFKTQKLILTRQTITATGNLLYVNDVEVGATISGNLILTGQSLSNTIASTGQQAWNHSQNNALNLSGNLNASGRRAWDDAINLSGRIFATGVAAISHANSIGSNLSGNLNASGRRAWDDAINLSGRLFATGSILDTYIDAVSGNLILTGQTAQNNALNLSGSLFLTGSNLYNLLIAESGSLKTDIANSVSGLISTGAADVRYYPNDSNPSGFITTGQTGEFYLASNPAQYATSGNLNESGRRAWDDAVNLSGRLVATGLILDTYIDAVSGNLVLTGQIAQSNALNLSGNLNASGRRAWDDAINLSGRIFATGALIASVSGGLQVQISSNDSDIQNLSGRLFLTGSTLDAKINVLSGQVDGTFVHRTGNESISGIKTFLTGIIEPNTKTSAFSFILPIGNDNTYEFAQFTFTNGASSLWITATCELGGISISKEYILPVYYGATQNVWTKLNAISASPGYAGNDFELEVLVNNGILLLRSRRLMGSVAGNMWISIKEDGRVSSSIATPLSNTGISGALTLNYPSTVITQFSSTAFVRGNLEISGNASVSGSLIATQIYVNGMGTNVSGNINSSGRRAWDDAINLSGRLFATGSILDTYIDTVSGNLILSGQIAQNNALNLSGNLNASGRRAWDDAMNLSGRLFATGSTLDNKINSAIAGAANAVFTTGIQTISGNKTFLGTTYIANLIVTGTQTIVNTEEFDVGSNFITLNATGGARDAGIFVSTGFTGGNSTGALIGFDVPSNTWRFGINAQNADLLLLPRIASGEAVDALDVRLVQSGFNIYTTVNEISGNLTLSGQIAQNNALNLSGNLNASGRRAWDDATNLSGRLFATGALITSVSGGLEARITNLAKLTGQNIFSGRNDFYGAIRILSGLQNGADSFLRIGKDFLSNDDSYALSIGSTNNVQAGIVLRNAGSSSNGESIFFSSGLPTSDNRFIRLKAFGPTFTMTAGMGLGSQTDFFRYTDYNVGISVNPTESLHASGFIRADAGFKSGTTNIADIFATQNALVATGRRAWDDATNLSGRLFATGALLASVSGGLQAQISSNDSDISNLSGRLFATGAALSAVSVTGSTVMQTPIFTGLGGSLVIQSGNFVLFSGAGGSAAAPNNGDGINLSGRLTATGAILFSNDLNLSGSINASGRRAWDDATNLSGRLFATGSTLDSKINSLSGQIDAFFVHRTGNELISGEKTFVNNVIITGTNATPAALIVSKVVGGGAAKAIEIATITNSNPADAGVLHLITLLDGSVPNNSRFELQVDNGAGTAKTLNLQPSGGRVGIGTPYITSQMLEVNGGIGASGTISTNLGFISGITNIADIFYPKNINPSGYIRNVETGAFDNIFVHRTGNESINGSKFFLAGNVGIGTINPTYNLEVTGSFAAASKSFVINHPTKEGLKLQHGVVEGPEHSVFVRGRLFGSGIIQLPDYWSGLVYEDTITVQLTPIGKYQKLYVDKISNDFIVVKNNSLFGSINCHYLVQAERKDIEKIKVEF